jgi:1,4-alpha-glucan branching enzyme
VPDEPAAGVKGDLAIVLHSHMPYVEGFGTYPFGEEWLFDAFARSHLPVLEVARDLTLTVTPVLADQLEAAGVGDRMLEFLRRYRLGAAETDAAEADAGMRPAAEAEAAHYRRAVERLDAVDGAAVDAFRGAGASGRIELMASAATHAVMPKLATAAGRRLQLDAGLRSHTRRFGRPRGVWLPECAYAPGLEAVLAERGIAYTCLDQSSVEPDGAALVPIKLPGGPLGFTIDWPMVSLVWGQEGYPGAPEYLEYHRLSVNGTRLWSISGDPYEPERALRRAEADAASFLEAVGSRLERHRSERGERGLCVFAIDTELLGHWWAEGPLWLRAVLDGAGRHGVRLLKLSDALSEHPGEDRPAREASWGEGKSLETWDSPSVADLAWAARRLELRLLRAVRAGVPRERLARAARELLAVQSSDWAFMDHRAQAGDYPYRRVVTHAGSLLEALDSSREAPRKELRNLAPDLSLAPLREP